MRGDCFRTCHAAPIFAPKGDECFAEFLTALADEEQRRFSSRSALPLGVPVACRAQKRRRRRAAGEDRVSQKMSLTAAPTLCFWPHASTCDLSMQEHTRCRGVAGVPQDARRRLPGLRRRPLSRSAAFSSRRRPRTARRVHQSLSAGSRSVSGTRYSCWERLFTARFDPRQNAGPGNCSCAPPYDT